MAFVGTHEHSLDEKGRLVLPAKFRSYFAGAAYLTPHAGCLALWTPDGFDEMLSRLKEQIRTGEVEARVRRGLARCCAHSGTARGIHPRNGFSNKKLDKDLMIMHKNARHSRTTAKAGGVGGRVFDRQIRHQAV